MRFSSIRLFFFFGGGAFGGGASGSLWAFPPRFSEVKDGRGYIRPRAPPPPAAPVARERPNAEEEEEGRKEDTGTSKNRWVVVG